MIEWAIVEKTPNQALEGNWKRKGVKEHIRKEAHERCVYCGIHENFIGGKDAFHKDHYRPKSIFIDLENSLDNLYYACPICNRFKSDEWPGDPEENHSAVAFPDPAEIDYNELFKIDQQTGLVEGVYVDSIYTLNQLCLNRPQLTLTRREYNLQQRSFAVTNSMLSLLPYVINTDSEEAKSLIGEYMRALRDLHAIVNVGQTIPRYEKEDIRRS